MKAKITIGVVAVLLLSCCAFAAWRRLMPTEHASGDPGCYVETGSRDRLRIGRCDELHTAEVVDFFYPAGADAGCHSAAETFLGGPLRDARVVLRQLPSMGMDFTSVGCALIEVSDSAGTTQLRSSSLRGTMTGDRPMAITCGQLQQQVLVYLRCADPHDAEFTGAVADGGQPETSCGKAAADYLGVHAEELAARHDLQVTWLADPRDGDTTGCLLAGADPHNPLTGSLHGLRAAPLPTG